MSPAIPHRQADSREPLGRALAGSLATHAAIVGAFALTGFLNLKDNWGANHASSGAIGVELVSRIPIPQEKAPPNPVASDTDNQAPQEASEAKARPQVKAPPTEGIAVPDRLKKQPKKNSPAPPVYRPMAYQPNQVYSKSAQAANSPMFGMSGAGGIDIGPASVLGNRFGAYVQLMRDRIAQHWSTADVRSTPQQFCTISFTIARDGTVTNVQVAKPSGNYLLDTSAKRAVMDASPLPALPREVPKNEATVELKFQLNK
ncbi:MAG: TonB family protein [Bryobacterales bacterium]|jgi:protein TonB|nr:TonB family protein [Bryobacterales bacterium]